MRREKDFEYAFFLVPDGSGSQERTGEIFLLTSVRALGFSMDKSQADMAGISAVFIESIPGGTVTAVKEDNG